MTCIHPLNAYLLSSLISPLNSGVYIFSFSPGRKSGKYFLVKLRLDFQNGRLLPQHIVCMVYGLVIVFGERRLSLHEP